MRQSAPTKARATANSRHAPASGGKRPKNKRRRSRPLVVFLLLAVFAFVATLGVMGYMVYEEIGHVEKLNTFYPGVFIDDNALYGATPQQAYDYLIGKARADMDGWSLTLQFGDQTWSITTDTLGMNRSLETVISEAVNKAFYIGRTGSIFERYQEIVKLKTEPYKAYTSGVEKNMAQIDYIIEEIQRAVYVEPADASREFKPDRQNAIVITGETVGRALDVQALKAEIVAMVNGMESGTIQVPTVDVQPTYTADSLSGDIVKLASVFTKISSTSTAARNSNIQVGCDRFNGKIVAPGERVSFNAWVGKRTPANGFHEAEEIVYGEYEMGVGGGICQVSTTLYKAVIQAGLEVVDRTNHGIPVRYAEMGSDATVADRGIDFVFRNNTDSYIYLTASIKRESGDNRCYVEIYGRPDPNGYKYGFRHEQIERIDIPKPVEVKDKDGTYVRYTDQSKQVFDGAYGYRIRTYRVVVDAKGQLIEEKVISEDYYKPQAPRIYVGVSRRE